MDMLILLEVINYYLGQNYRYRKGKTWFSWHKMTLDNFYKLMNDTSVDKIQLALKPLADLGEQEHIELAAFITRPGTFDPLKARTYRNQFGNIVVAWGNGPGTAHHTFSNQETWTPGQFQYLIIRGYDVFGLIAAGEAVDIKTVKL